MVNMNYILKIFKHNTPEYSQALELRNRILRIPLGLNFTEAELKRDETDMHFGLFDGDKIVACLILSNAGNGKVQMRQVAVDDNKQGEGLGKQLSLAAEKNAAENGYTLVFCHARKTAVPFYKKLGYKIVSDEYTEVNIPHYTMEKPLK